MYNRHDALQMEVVHGQWQPVTLWNLVHLADHGDIVPSQRMRFCINGEWEECLASNLPSIPRRSMLKRTFGSIRRVLEKRGDPQAVVEPVVERIARMRGWAPSTADAVATGAPGSRDLDSGMSAWFELHLDFAEALVRHASGASFAAEHLYRRILESGVTDRRLVFCVKHQLAVVLIQDGKDEGVCLLCELIEDGIAQKGLTSGPTDYCFAELVRHFLNRGQPHYRIDRTLKQDAIIKQVSPPKPDVGWDARYQAVHNWFWDRARNQGFGGAGDWLTFCPRQPSPWETGASDVATSKVPAGLLVPLGAQDIESHISSQPLEICAMQDRISHLREHAEQLSSENRYDEAISVIDQLLKLAADADDFLTIRLSAARWREVLEVRSRAAAQASDDFAEQALLKAVREVELLPLDEAEIRLVELKAKAQMLRGSDGVSWHTRLAEAENRLVNLRRKAQERNFAEQRENIRQWIMQGQFSAAELELAKFRPRAGSAPLPYFEELMALIHRKQAQRLFDEGLELLGNDPDQAEARLAEAVTHNAELGPLAAPLSVASRLFRLRTQASILPPTLAVFHQQLLECVTRLMQFRRRDAAAGQELWVLVTGLAENLMASAEPNDSRVSEVAAAICEGLGRYRSVEGVLDTTSKLIEDVGAFDPQFSMINTRTWFARMQVRFHCRLAEGEKSRAAGKSKEAIAKFREAIRDNPTESEAWRKLIDCCVDDLQIPAAWKPEWVARMEGNLTGLQNNELNSLFKTPEKWVEERIRELAAEYKVSDIDIKPRDESP